jgi:hypothetical protein
MRQVPTARRESDEGKTEAGEEVKRLPFLWRIALYSLTTAIVAAWFLVRNARTVCAMCQDHLHYGFPFPYIDIGAAVANRHALLWPGAIADTLLILSVGFISAKGISSLLLLTISWRDSSSR